MAIETQDEWNARLAQCGCCEMPDWDNPTLLTQHATWNGSTAGYAPPIDGEFTIEAWIRYLVRTRSEVGFFHQDDSYTSGEVSYEIITSRDYDWIRTYTYGGLINQSGNCLAFTPATIELVCTGSGSQSDINVTRISGEVSSGTERFETTSPKDPSAVGSNCQYTREVILRTWDDEEGWVETTNTTTSSSSAVGNLDEEYKTITDIYSEGINWVGWLVLARAAAEAFFTGLTEPCWGLASPSSLYATTPPASQAGTGFAQLRRLRYFFRIPVTHLGTWFKITWDIAEYPVDGEDLLITEGLTYEWTGPGTGAFDDPSWQSPFYFLEPPTVPGYRQIVNIRTEGYPGTMFGVRPKAMGLAFPAA